MPESNSPIEAKRLEGNRLQKSWRKRGKSWWRSPKAFATHWKIWIFLRDIRRANSGENGGTRQPEQWCSGANKHALNCWCAVALSCFEVIELRPLNVGPVRLQIRSLIWGWWTWAWLSHRRHRLGLAQSKRKNLKIRLGSFWFRASQKRINWETDSLLESEKASYLLRRFLTTASFSCKYFLSGAKLKWVNANFG